MRSSADVPVIGAKQRHGPARSASEEQPHSREDSTATIKSFVIPKRLIWEAWKRVAANQGAPGVDKESIQSFQKHLGRNLYTLWNRMSAGSYFPKPVRQVEIPKADGRTRTLGVPTVTDRVAQMVVKEWIEPGLENVFHSSSFGYRPGRSAHQALAQARRHCWRHDWVIDLDISNFFDTLDHDLLLKAVRKHVPESWIRLYIERWLKCDSETPDGELISRTQGTPQGGVVSPVLANLYLHYTFDAWMQKYHPGVPFERYADDVICHCRSEGEAQALLDAIRNRLAQCHLALHPEKTRVVYCKDGRRPGDSAHTQFDFLGFCFRRRSVQDRNGKLFIGFNPAVSPKALKHMNLALRELCLHRQIHWNLEQIAARINPMVQGWVQYFGIFHPLPLERFLARIDLRLGRWVRRKYKRIRGHKRRSWAWLKGVRAIFPRLFVHWEYLYLKGQRAGRAV
ncbi:MAG: group II intron reverse transcriptase/maturase [Gammaproteobacteria bacterium]|nr:group II intron reverse transcriptase/maturase [Gammaproteobacteria bacterium]